MEGEKGETNSENRYIVKFGESLWRSWTFLLVADSIMYIVELSRVDNPAGDCTG